MVDDGAHDMSHEVHKDIGNKGKHKIFIPAGALSLGE
jgi:hypothetical protein